MVWSGVKETPLLLHRAQKERGKVGSWCAFNVDVDGAFNSVFLFVLFFN